MKRSDGKKISFKGVRNWNTIHIITRGNRFAVRKENSLRATKIFDDKKEAIKFARAKYRGQEIVVHRKDGTIEKWYNKSSHPL